MTTVVEVIEYLKQNPSFFDDHIDLLVELNLGDNQDITPFYQRQLQVLKERESQHKAKINAIVDGAKSNLKLESDFLELAISLLSEGQNGQDPLDCVSTIIKRQFNIKQVVILLSSEEGDCEHEKFDEIRQRVNHKGSICDDRVSSSLLQSIFHADTEEIQSCAFIPLIYQQHINGVMVLGSSSKDRFQPDDGVLFLNRIGLLVGSYIKGAV